MDQKTRLFSIKYFSAKVLAFIFLWWASIAYTQEDQRLRLWYDHPSGAIWENALPIGNGRLGAMVYGNVVDDILQLNEHTLWSGSPNRNDNPLALDSLEVIRSLIFEGRQKEAEKIANRVIISKKSQGQMFLPAGEMHVHFDDHEKYTDYKRELDIEKAIAKTSYKVNDILYTREVLASLPDRVIDMKISGSKKKSVSFQVSYLSSLPGTIIKTLGKDQLTFAGTSTDHEGIKGMIKYKGIIEIKPTGGEVFSTDSSISIKNADEVVLLISIATNFINYQDLSGDENNSVATYLQKAASKSYRSIVKDHIAAYQKYFNRVVLDLGTNKSASLPTDIRLKNFNTTEDPALVTLYYQYGRYLLISSSQPGGQPANLQGIWNNKVRPPWDSKYTININAEMNYWPAEKTNLSELHEPFLQMVKDLSVTGQQTAHDMYGSRGWMAHHNTDIWRATGAVDGAFWGAWMNGGGWSIQHLWEHYLYTGDQKFLSSVYPIFKGAALFYIDMLVKHPAHPWWVLNPDMSPENAPAAHQGSSLDAGTTMSNQIMFDVFSITLKTGKILNNDPGFADTLSKVRSQLAPMHIGQYDQLQEWLEDIDNPEDHHRHISHLYGLYPSSQISAYRTPLLFAAARNSLIQRGDVSTGWSMGWKVNWWAKLQDGNHAYTLIKKQL
ncbi:MAG: glycoside hydrolase family 95 protein, partial [Saprospiraceae bacterium]